MLPATSKETEIGDRANVWFDSKCQCFAFKKIKRLTLSPSTNSERAEGVFLATSK